MTPVKLAFNQVLYESRGPIDYAYFPTGAVLSALTVMTDGNAIEVATFGNEGLAGNSAATGGKTSPNKVIVQIGDGGLRVEVAALQEEVARSGPFRDLLVNYSAAFMAQVSQSVACNGLHRLEQRCCRWLLMTRDRVDSDDLRLTHEYLAIMLGARRASVTDVLGPLQEAGLVRSHRGRIIILDRAGLEVASVRVLPGRSGRIRPAAGRRAMTSHGSHPGGEMGVGRNPLSIVAEVGSRGRCGGALCRAQPLSRRLRHRECSGTESGGEIGMLAGTDALEDHRQDPGRIAADHRGRVEPEAGEDLAAEDAVGPGSRRLYCPPGRTNQSIARSRTRQTMYSRTPLPAIDALLLAEVDAGAAGRDLGHQLGAALDVIVRADPHSPAALRADDQERVGLGHVSEVEADAAVVARLHTGSAGPIDPQPAHELECGSPWLINAHGRWHVHDSFDELGLLQARHRVVATLEFVAGQVFAVDQERNRLVGRGRLQGTFYRG